MLTRCLRPVVARRLSSQRGRNVYDLSLNSQRDKAEEIVGVWIFHRHGDRTPGKSIVAESCREAESDFWCTKIPPLDRTYYQMLSENFPANIHSNEGDGIGEFRDADSGNDPYGFLTWKGMQQLYEVGDRLSKCYGSTEDDSLFTEFWDVKAFSTRYLRTVKSCQCLLDGLLRKSPIVLKTEAERNETHYENVRIEEYQKSSHSPRIPVVVREDKHETLNPFDSSPELMKKLIKDVAETHAFIEQDSKAAPLAARLSSFLPGLIEHNVDGPSRINWIHAADHFICRASHNIPLTAFSHHENIDSVENNLYSMQSATIAHLVLRFRLRYENPTFLAAMVVPALSEIKDQMKSIVTDELTDSSVRKPFTIFSCHDVDILAILYGVEAAFLGSDRDLHSVGLERNDHLSCFWPGYASTLAFELVRKKKLGIEDEFLVRIHLDGKQISTMIALRQKKDVMNLCDFGELLDRTNDDYPRP